MHGDTKWKAGLAQLVEQLIRNEQVVGSSPTISSNGKPRKCSISEVLFCVLLRFLWAVDEVAFRINTHCTKWTSNY